MLRAKYDDGGFSGGNTVRPALQRLLADVEAGKVDVIVVYKGALSGVLGRCRGVEQASALAISGTIGDVARMAGELNSITTAAATRSSYSVKAAKALAVK